MYIKFISFLKKLTLNKTKIAHLGRSFKNEITYRHTYSSAHINFYKDNHYSVMCSTEQKRIGLKWSAGEKCKTNYGIHYGTLCSH